MPRTPLIALICILACVSGQPRAQTTPPSVPPDLEELRKAFRDDENERQPITPLPGPTVTHHEVIRPSRLLWTCVGTSPGQPIYSEPDPNSKPIGMTTKGAAAGSDSGKFVRVLMYSGLTGYIPADTIHEYADPEHPGVTCVFRGLNQFGGPVFELHSPSKH